MKKLTFLFVAFTLLVSFKLYAQEHNYPELLLNNGSRAQMLISPLSDGTILASDLVEAILPTGTSYDNVTVSGPEGMGLFSGGYDAGLDLDEGTVFGSGCINQINLSYLSCDIYGLPGDADLNSLGSGYITQDAAILEFDFTPSFSLLNLRFIYATFEQSSFWEDPCGVFLDGTNIATLPGGSEISLSNIWNTPDFFINGPIQGYLYAYSSTFDISAPVAPGVQHHIKIVIADGYDQAVPTFLFIEKSTDTVPFAWWAIALGMALILGFTTYRFIAAKR